MVLVNVQDMLTSREKEIIRLEAKASTNKQSADELFIREETVKKHPQNIFKELKANNKIQPLNKLNERK
jgi:DNA-binding NarL/FixJ family response regulator